MHRLRHTIVVECEQIKNKLTTNLPPTRRYLASLVATICQSSFVLTRGWVSLPGMSGSTYGSLAQRAADDLVGLREIEALGIELAATPALQVPPLFPLLRLRRQQYPQELEVAVRTADILGRTAAGTVYASGGLW